MLHSLVEKLQEGKAVSQEVQRREYERVGLLPRSEAADTVNTEKIGWREMLFGRQKSEADIKRESQETQDIEDCKFLLRAGSLLSTLLIRYCSMLQL